jgi:putative tryptophan/tyrosine transport system substrate-binding protein
MVTRRDCLAVLLAAPVAAHAQPARKSANVVIFAPSDIYEPYTPFREELKKLGHKDARIVVRNVAGRLDLLVPTAKEIAALAPDVVVTINTPPAQAIASATKTIPVVMGILADPAATGLVKNLARPGGNLTGVSNYGGELAEKRLAILKETVPGLRRLAVFHNPDDPITPRQVRDVDAVKGRVGVEVRHFTARSLAAFEPVLADAMTWRPDALMWLAGQQELFVKRTIAEGVKQHLPVMLIHGKHVEMGALICYWPDLDDLFRQMAGYVDRILRGAKAGELPVLLPSVYELVVNQNTARQIGIKVPQSVLLRANRVIE